MTIRIPTSLAGCNDLVKSATAAEMIFAVTEIGSRQGMTAEEWSDYNHFVEAAAHLFVAAIPHFIRPANIGGDMVVAVERYRRDGIERRPDPAEGESAMEADDFEVGEKERTWGMC